METKLWHNTRVKYSVVLRSFNEYMRDPKVKDAHKKPYDNRHLRLKTL